MGADHLKNPVIKLTPDPPVKGGSFTIEASGTLDEPEGEFNSNVDLQFEALSIFKSSVSGSLPVTVSPAAVKGPFTLKIGPLTPPSTPGSTVLKGQIHVTNGKDEPIMCIELDVDVGAAEATEEPIASQEHLPALQTVNSCGKSTDHIPDFSITTADGVYTAAGTLDEALTKTSLDIDLSLKVLFLSVPFKMNVPLEVSDGEFQKGSIKAVVGPWKGKGTNTVKPDGLNPTLKGTVKLNDDKAEEVMCINVDTVIAEEKPLLV